MNRLRTSIQAWMGLRRLQQLPEGQRRVVFYAETGADRVHLAGMVDELTGRHEQHVTYVTSDARDPMLKRSSALLRVAYIGEGAARTAWFLSLRAAVVVMTMPDLDVYHLKRSRVAQPHYVYTFHSPVSTHMIYRPKAFDHYDTILCAGPHQCKELRARERLMGLPSKRLVECGYPRLDALRASRLRAGGGGQTAPAPGRNSLHIVVAPSWGPHGLLEAHGPSVVGVLLDAGYTVSVRPHPVTLRKWPKAISVLESAHGRHPRFRLERDVAASDSYDHADAMVSDWSGAAWEFAFACEKPVVFIDVPRKVNNPGYAAIGSTPVEVAIRQSLGTVVAPDRISDLPGTIERVVRDPTLCDAITAARNAATYNLDRSAAIAADEIARLAKAAVPASSTAGNVSAPPKAARSTDAEDIQVARVLVRLASGQAGKPSERDVADLDAICRALSLEGTLSARYAPDWKRLAGAPELPADDLARACGVLLSAGDGCSCSGAAATIDGWRTKCLNGALVALDALERDSRSPASSRLRTRADRMLDALAGEAV